jgi:large subunit ribosomal protein L4
MKLTVKDSKGNNAGELEVVFPIIENGKGSQAVHDAVVAYQANQRMGTACTKTVGEVAGTNKKPWRQKGTGRARAGSFASPLWRGGGVTFGPKPRDFGKKVSKTTRHLAFRKALSARLQAGDVLVVEDLKLASPKTKEFLGLISALQISGSTLVVDAGDNANLRLASRNVPHVHLTSGTALNTYLVLKYDKLLFTRPAFAQVEQRLK